MKIKALLPLLCVAAALASTQDVKLGIIGTDTSHATAFTKLLNDLTAADHISGARVVAAYKGGSPDIEESAKRVDEYAAEIQGKWSVKIVPAIADLCPRVDGILLEIVDARPHLAQFQDAVKCGKPVFIDKPLASTLADALAIAALASNAHIPWLSASALRFSEVPAMQNPDVTGAIVWAPGPTEPHHQLDLTWYGIPGVEMLYAILGTGCIEAQRAQRVPPNRSGTWAATRCPSCACSLKISRMTSTDEDVITGCWSDGRLGVIHLERPYGTYGAITFLKGEKIDSRPDLQVSYIPLVQRIVEFMHTRQPAVPNNVTLEMFAFTNAAQSAKGLEASRQGRKELAKSWVGELETEPVLRVWLRRSLQQNSAAVKLVPGK